MPKLVHADRRGPLLTSPWCYGRSGAYLDLLLGWGDSTFFFNSGSKFTSKIFGNI
jgi:hypothetical protein